MNRLILFVIFLVFVGPVRAQNDAVKEIQEHRKKQFEELKDKSKSPLDKKTLRKFKGLDYYPIDLSYRVNATFVKNENPVLFKMSTTTTRLPEYVKYGDVYFTLHSKEYALEVYQSQDVIKRPGYEDYLFIPFTDETNGSETYDVGRYIEFRIPKDEEVIIDFNKCYNPYCAYSDRFSCPIPPRANSLPVAVKAGEKKFLLKDH